jgi:hypothetical protein
VENLIRHNIKYAACLNRLIVFKDLDYKKDKIPEKGGDLEDHSVSVSNTAWKNQVEEQQSTIDEHDYFASSDSAQSRSVANSDAKCDASEH